MENKEADNRTLETKFSYDDARKKAVISMPEVYRDEDAGKDYIEGYINGVHDTLETKEATSENESSDLNFNLLRRLEKSDARVKELEEALREAANKMIGDHRFNEELNKINTLLSSTN